MSAGHPGGAGGGCVEGQGQAQPPLKHFKESSQVLGMFRRPPHRLKHEPPRAKMVHSSTQ